MRWYASAVLGIAWAVLVAAALAAEADPVARDEQTLREAKLATDGPGLLEFFRKRSANDADGAKVKELIKQLGDDSFDVREKASARLITLGPPAIPHLKVARKDPDVEVVRRAEECLRRIGEGSAGTLIDAAVRLLAARKPAGAAEALLAYMPAAEDEIVIDEIRDALVALAVRDGKAEPALLAALTDKLPARRAAAAAALARSGLAEPRPAVSKLLEDTDLAVRLHAALALANAREKKAVPVLINLLGELPAARSGLALDLLHRLAAGQGPAGWPGPDEAARKKYRDAWADWWAKNGDKADLAALDQPPKPLGYTLIVLLDQGRLMEVDAEKKMRWKIDGLVKPLDVQMLPGDRVLVAEQEGNKVTERSLDGKVLWEKQINDPLVAQRLPGGNTFIATRTQAVEVDRDGKEVFTWNPPNGELIKRAVRLPAGDLALVLAAPDETANRFVRLDSTGTTELQNFPVDVNTYGGRIEVLPNRRVLIPQMRNNQVVEYNARGKIVWEVTVEQPIVATRLPNGNTLATSMSQLRAVELDRAGKEIWEYKNDTRVTRALRR